MISKLTAIIKRRWAGLLCLCACAGVLAFMLFGYPAQAAYQYPSIFVNDKVFMYEENYPLITSEDIVYIPIYVFASLQNGQIKLNPGNESFYIAVGDKYLSFDTAASSAIAHDKKVYSIKTMKYNLMRYVPLEQICDILSVNYERDVSKKSVRIYDQTATLSFAQLLGEFDPPTTIPPTTVPTTTQRPTVPAETTTQDNTPTQDTTQPEDTTPRAVSFAFAGQPGEHAEQILDLLSDRGVSCAFYLTSRDIGDDPDLVRRLVVDGHSVGVLIETPDWEPVLDDAENLLSAAAKIKPRYLLTRDTQSSVSLYLSQLYTKGYTLRQHPFTPKNYTELKERFLAGEQLYVLLDYSSESRELLKGMFELLDSKSYYSSKDYS
ncbi:MAG: polysaccharide deacetylase family protein [Eubacteriales bacterium]